MKNSTLSLIYFLAFTYHSAFGQSIATYNILFTNHWNGTDHGPLPSNPHWSKLVGANHKNTITFLEAGSIASEGIENIAEVGNNTNFKMDVITSISEGHSEQYIDGNSLYLSESSTISINEVQVSDQFPLLTLVSMIAPSPDWMVFINNLNLRTLDNTGWKNNVSVDLSPYDAGTDSGSDYNSPNADITEHILISSLQGVSPFNSNKVATINISLQNVLTIDDFNLSKSIKIYPNPTKDRISISNPQNIQIKSIEIYSVLGHLVNLIPAKNIPNKIDLDISYLNRGVYTLKLNIHEKNSKIEKLIVE